ncbi:MAG: radical SAM protein, partial [Clostridia bacterium]|nr:radical SAM protein [Clostridia bacterium]
MSRCFDCPRRCGADREAGDTGFCRSPYLPVIARAALHIGEE